MHSPQFAIEALQAELQIVMNQDLTVEALTDTRIPTVDGTYRLKLFSNSLDEKDHMALVYGDIDQEEDVLVRVHSECFTGDVIGSLRCDCGEQLNTSMRMIAQEGAGIVLYLRQEGRGIGLLDKMRAYELQDEGYDTVEANLMLGHQADERDYSIGARMLDNLGVGTVRLLTNNPEKIESLQECGITVSERVPLQSHMNRHNTDYLQTKVDRMRHLLDVGPREGVRSNSHSTGMQVLLERAAEHYELTGRPFVTLSYAQSLDGSIAAEPSTPLAISNDEALTYTHRLRASHDAILVGIGTVLADDPRLTVRRVEGAQPRPVVLDTNLRFPPDAQLLQSGGPSPIVATNRDADAERMQRLKKAGATIIHLPCDESGLNLDALLDALGNQGIRSVMVEGGGEIITSFLREQAVQHVIVTLAPMFVGGVSSLQARLAENGQPFPQLENLNYQWAGENLILHGDLEAKTPAPS